MKQTTHIYILADNSVYARQHKWQMHKNIVKISRSLQLLPNKTKLHLIYYNDKAHIGNATQQPTPHGNPNFATALNFLQSVIDYENKYGNSQTRSVVLWYSAGNVLREYEGKLQRLFKNKVFNKALRYVVSVGNPDNYCKQAFNNFVDSPQDIVHYFSAGRLCSLVKSINTQYRVQRQFNM